MSGAKRRSLVPIIVVTFHAQNVDMRMSHAPFHHFILPQRNQEERFSKAYVSRRGGAGEPTEGHAGGAVSPGPLLAIPLSNDPELAPAANRGLKEPPPLR